MITHPVPAGVVGMSDSLFGVSNFIGSLDSFETAVRGVRCGRLGMPLGSGFTSKAGAGGGPDAKVYDNNYQKLFAISLFQITITILEFLVQTRKISM